MRSAELEVVAPARDGRGRRFAVSWRNSTSNAIHPVGILEADEAWFRFQYLSTVKRIADFRPFIGFSRLDEVYVSTKLWPFFSLRAMDPRRPDFELYASRLGLESDSSVLDILSRSGGETQGDRVSVVEAPKVASDGSTEYVFLVRGSRYATAQFSSVGVVDQLRVGDQLSLMPDVSNPVNSDALLLAADGHPIGWVPDLLVPYFRTLAEDDAELIVERNNGSDAPWHLRLLVKVRGVIDPMYRAFVGPSWTTGGH